MWQIQNSIFVPPFFPFAGVSIAHRWVDKRTKVVEKADIGGNEIQGPPGMY
jgi:hypothetical protein